MKNWLMAITIVFLSLSVLTAQDVEESRKTLKGISVVYVAIESLDPDAQRDGLSLEQIRTDVELRLRMAGIKVLTFEESQKVGWTQLYIMIDIYKRSSTVYSTLIRLEVLLGVRLTRDPQIYTIVDTWSVAGQGDLNNLNLARDRTKDLVDQFINARLLVNPKR